MGGIRPMGGRAFQSQSTVNKSEISELVGKASDILGVENIVLAGSSCYADTVHDIDILVVSTHDEIRNRLETHNIEYKTFFGVVYSFVLEYKDKYVQIDVVVCSSVDHLEYARQLVFGGVPDSPFSALHRTELLKSLVKFRGLSLSPFGLKQFVPKQGIKKEEIIESLEKRLKRARTLFSKNEIVQAMDLIQSYNTIEELINFLTKDKRGKRVLVSRSFVRGKVINKYIVESLFLEEFVDNWKEVIQAELKLQDIGVLDTFSGVIRTINSLNLPNTAIEEIFRDFICRLKSKSIDGIWNSDHYRFLCNILVFNDKNGVLLPIESSVYVKHMESIPHIDNMSIDDIKRIFTCPDEITITEKIDGENLSFGVSNDGRIYTKTKNGSITFDSMYYNKDFLQQFKLVHDYLVSSNISDVLKKYKQIFASKYRHDDISIQIMSELLAGNSNTIEYNLGKNLIYIFDIAINGVSIYNDNSSEVEEFKVDIQRCLTSQNWIVDFAEDCNIDKERLFILLNRENDLREFFDVLYAPRTSKFGNVLCEGSVVRNTKTGKYVKIVNKNTFSDWNRENWKNIEASRKIYNEHIKKVQQEVFGSADIIINKRKLGQKIVEARQSNDNVLQYLVNDIKKQTLYKNGKIFDLDLYSSILYDCLEKIIEIKQLSKKQKEQQNIEYIFKTLKNEIDEINTVRNNKSTQAVNAVKIYCKYVYGIDLENNSDQY